MTNGKHNWNYEIAPNNHGCIYGNEGECIATVHRNDGDEIRDDRGDYIVKAVNCHEQLVEALKAAMHGVGDERPWYKQAQAALAAVEAQ